MSAITALCVMTAVVVPQFAVDPLNRFQHQNAGLHVERTGRLVAQQHVGTLGHGSGNRHALLLAARHLGRKVIDPIRQIDQRQRFVGFHRIAGDLGDQRRRFRGPSGWG